MGFRGIGDVSVGAGARIDETALVGIPADDEEAGSTVIGADAVIGPFAVVHAGCRIGANFNCGAGAVIGPRVQMGDDCSVGCHSVVRNAVLGSRIEIQEMVLLGILPKGKYDYKGAADGWEPVVKIGSDSIVRSHTAIYAKTVFGEHLNCGHGALIRECVLVGDHTTIGTGACLDGFATIGSRVTIHTKVTISQYSVMEDDSYITMGAMLTNTLHPRCAYAKQCMKGATVKRGAKVSANVTVGPGITIGENALVGAGAVVTKDVPATAVVVGVPAKIICWAGDLRCRSGLCDGPYPEAGREREVDH